MFYVLSSPLFLPQRDWEVTLAVCCYQVDGDRIDQKVLNESDCWEMDLWINGAYLWLGMLAT